MKVKLVTSFNETLWNKYGKECISTWVENLELDEGSEIEIWVNGEFPRGLPLKTSSGVPFKYKSLDTQSEGWVYFYQHWSNHVRPEVSPQDNFRFNFLPFSCKVFALAEAAWKCKQGYPDNSPVPQQPGELRLPQFDVLMWLDADVKMIQKVNGEYLKNLLGNAELAWLDRGAPWGHGETGFILAKTTESTLDTFLAQANVYGSGQLFFFAEWHDAFIFTSLVRHQEFTLGEHFKVNNLNKDMGAQHKQGLYPFETSPLSTHFVHYKGPLKDNIECTTK